MEKFIRHQNSALFRKRLADPDLTDAQRKVILKLLTEEQAGRRQATLVADDGKQ
jgi:hypothetical protein